MNRFSQFNIKAPAKGFEGSKIKISRILNKEVVIHDFKIEESKVQAYKEKGSGKCLYLQISFDNEMHVVFTSGSGLMAQYFSRITADHWMAKNRLEKAAHEVAREMDRRIVPGDQVNAFKDEFKSKIDSINKTNARCKPLELNIHNDYLDRGDISFYISMVFNFSLFLAKE